MNAVALETSDLVLCMHVCLTAEPLNSDLLLELAEKAKLNGNVLKDSYAKTSINQARALATILNEWVLKESK